MIADDSGLVVPALGGAPVCIPRVTQGPGASDADRIRKLLDAMRGKKAEERRARFVCVLGIGRAGRSTRRIFGIGRRRTAGCLARRERVWI